MARVPLVDPDSAPEPIGEILASTPLNLLRVVAHAQSAFLPWSRYSTTLLTRLELDPLLRELAILQVAHLARSEYEWSQHVVIARATGASDEQIAAIDADRDDDPSLDEGQRLVLGFAREVITDGSASDESVHALVRSLGARQLVELLLVIGHYQAIARLIATVGLDPDPPVGASLPGLGGQRSA